MPVVVSNRQPAPDLNLDALTALVIPLSRRLAGAVPGDLKAVVRSFLADVAAATGAGDCYLLEFTDSLPNPHIHRPAGAANHDETVSQGGAPEPWLVERLGRGQLVVIASRD